MKAATLGPAAAGWTDRAGRITPTSLSATELWSALVVFVFSLGVTARVAWFLPTRSLWEDELLTSLNLVMRPLGQLLTGPLALDQTAPPLFLVLEWFSMQAGGVSEHSLRFPSLVAGLALLPVALWAFRPILGSFAIALFATIIAVSPTLVRYSAEVKPYGFDALFACAMAGIAIRLLNAPATRSLWIALFAVGIACTLGSLAAPFVLGATWILLATSSRVRSVPGGPRWLVGSAVAWGTLFGLIYFTLYAPVTSTGLMQRFWADAILAENSSGLWALTRRWIVGGLVGEAEHLLPRGAGVIVFLGLLGGLALARNQGGRVAWAVGGSIVLAYLASALGHFPLEVRLMLFSVPLVAAAIAAVADYGVVRLPRPTWRQAAMGACFLASAPGVSSLAEGGSAIAWVEETKPLVNDPVLEAHPREPVYLFVRAAPAWLFYRTDWDSPNRATANRLLGIVDDLGLASGSAPSRGRVRYGEGWGQVVEGRFRRWLVGVPSGYEAVFRTEWDPVSVDAGWADSEAERLFIEPGPCFWTFFSHFKPVESEVLDKAIRARGARLIYEHLESRAELRRYCEET
jgi:hypothetical protein